MDLFAVNLTMNLTCLVILVTLIISQILRRRNDMQNRLFLCVMILLMIECSADLMKSMLARFGAPSFIVTLFSFTGFAAGCVMFPVLFIYLLHDEVQPEPLKKKYRPVIVFSALVSALMMIVFVSQPYLYVEGAASIQEYEQGFRYFSRIAMIIQFLTLNLFSFTKKGSEVARRKMLIELSFFMILVEILDIVFSRFDFTTAASVFIVLMIYLNFQQEAEMRRESMELELLNTRISLILGKIRPDFVFDILSKIEDLCTKDSEKAQEVIATLSDYLRGNIDKIDTNDMILFQDELDHIQKYIELVRLSREDIRIRYDLAWRGFSLPRRSVYPVIEQFVDVCISEKHEDSLITIHSHKDEETATVAVCGPCRCETYDIHEANEFYQMILHRLSQLKGASLSLYCDRQKRLHAEFRLPLSKGGM